MANIQVALINASTQVTDQEVRSAVPALQTQIHRDFAPVWGVDAGIEFVSGSTQQLPMNAWWVVVVNRAKSATLLRRP